MADPTSIPAEDSTGFWAAVLAGAAGALAWLGRALTVSGAAKPEPPEDPREAREKRDATRAAILRIEDKIGEMAVAAAEDHARAEAQRDAMMNEIRDQRQWLLELSERTGRLENSVAAIKAVDEDRKDRKRN